MEVQMAFALRSIAGVVTLTVALVAASAASLAQTAAPAADGGSLVVYNGQHLELTKAWADGFTHATGVKVVLRNGNDTELANQIVQEGAV
jgi:iron(III) transport system substrate-binding protein